MAGTLAACGGGGDDKDATAPDAAPKRSATASLISSLEQSKAVKSGKLELAVKLRIEGDGSALKGPASITLDGPFQSTDPAALPRLDLTLAIDAPGEKKQTMRVVVTSTGIYVSSEGKAYSLGDAAFAQIKQAFATAAARSSSSGSSASGLAPLKALGVDPVSWLRDVREVGDEKVDGAEARHVHAAIDVARVLADVNALIGQAGALGLGGASGSASTRLTEAQIRDIERSITGATLDVWTAKDDRTLRKLAFHVGFDVPSDVRKRADGLESGAVDVALEITDVNEDQAIVAPKDAQPIGDLSSLLQGLLGGLGATTGSSATSAGSSPSSGAASELVECLQDAGGDTDRTRACAESAGR